MSYPKALDLITPTGSGTAEVKLPIGSSIKGSEPITTAVVSEMTGLMEEVIFDLRKKGKVALAGIITSLLQVGLIRLGSWERKSASELAPEGIVKSLFQADRETLFLAIMIATYPDEHVMTMTCPECEEKMTLPVDLKDTEVRPLTSGNPWVDFVLPRPVTLMPPPKGPGDKSVAQCLRGRFHFPTGTDTEMAVRAHGDNAARVASFLYSLKLKLFAEGTGEPLDVPFETAQKLPTSIRRAISNAIRDEYAGPILEARVNCPVCASAVAANLSLTDFFSAE